MKLVIITACCYADLQPIHMLRKSCETMNITLKPYGVGFPRNDWPYIKVDALIQALKHHRAEGITHALYTDGIDSLFVRTTAPILRVYQSWHCPPLVMSAEKNCFPEQNLADHFTGETPWKYPCAGQFMGEIDYLVDRWEFMRKEFAQYIDQGMIHQAWAGGYLPGAILDTWCHVFQSMADCGDDVTILDGKVLNCVTGTYPCVLHFNGGYVDPVTGRDEQMKKWWDALP